MLEKTDSTKTLVTIVSALVVVIILSTFAFIMINRQSAGSLIIETGESKLEMEFADNKVDFNYLISRLMVDEENKRNTLAILRDSYGLYEKNCPLLIDDIRKRSGNEPFSNGLRDLLVHLVGPFKREYHNYYDITIREIVEAINNLDYDHVVPKQFRELSDKELGIFEKRPIEVYVAISNPNRIPNEEAAVCMGRGGDLYRRQLLLIYETNPPLNVFANHYFVNARSSEKPCIMINPNNAKKLIGENADSGSRYNAILYPVKHGYKIAPLSPPPIINASTKEAL